MSVPKNVSEDVAYILQLLGAKLISRTEARNALGIDGEAPIVTEPF